MAIGTAQCCHLHYIKPIFQTIEQSIRKEDLKEGSKDEPLLTRMGSFRDRQKLFSNLSSEPQLQGVLRGKRLTSKSKPDNPKANQTRPVEKIQPSYLKSEPLGSTQQKNEKLHEKEVCTPKTDFNQVTLLQTDKKIDQSSLESEPLVSTQQENDKLHEKEVCTQKTDFDQVTLLQTDKKIDQSSLESEPIVSVQRDHTKMHGCQAHSVKTKTVCSAQDEGPLEANMTRTEEMNAKFGKKDPVGIEENETTEEDTVDIGTNVACLQTDTAQLPHSEKVKSKVTSFDSTDHETSELSAANIGTDAAIPVSAIGISKEEPGHDIFPKTIREDENTAELTQLDPSNKEKQSDITKVRGLTTRTSTKTVNLNKEIDKTSRTKGSRYHAESDGSKRPKSRALIAMFRPHGEDQSKSGEDQILTCKTTTSNFKSNKNKPHSEQDRGPKTSQRHMFNQDKEEKAQIQVDCLNDDEALKKEKVELEKKLTSSQQEFAAVRETLAGQVSLS